MQDNGGKSMFDGYMSRETPDFGKPDGSIYQSITDLPDETSQRQRIAALAQKWAGKAGWAEEQFRYQEGWGGSTFDPNTDVLFRGPVEPLALEEIVPRPQKHRR